MALSTKKLFNILLAASAAWHVRIANAEIIQTPNQNLLVSVNDAPATIDIDGFWHRI